MKKILKILLPFLVLSSLTFTGCKKKNNNESDKVYLSFGDVHATESKEIELADLNELVANKESFLLVINSTTCSCWSNFRSILNSYISAEKVLCYRITYETIKDSASKYNLPALAKGSTTFTIFENGAFKTSINTDDHDNIMYNQATFAKYMSEKTNLPYCYYITKDDVSSIKESGKNAVIYFARSGCEDSKRVNSGMLKDYYKTHDSGPKIYVIECQEYWKSPEDPDFDLYEKLKDDLGMATASNPTFGYGKGVFPFFLLIENGSYTSGAVVYNDYIVKEEGKYKVSDSYYSSERVSSLAYTGEVIVGKEIPESDLYIFGEYYAWKHEAADKVYKPIFNAFMDYVQSRINHSF